MTQLCELADRCRPKRMTQRYRYYLGDWQECADLQPRLAPPLRDFDLSRWYLRPDMDWYSLPQNSHVNFSFAVLGESERVGVVLAPLFTFEAGCMSGVSMCADIESSDMVASTSSPMPESLGEKQSKELVGSILMSPSPSCSSSSMPSPLDAKSNSPHLIPRFCLT